MTRGRIEAIGIHLQGHSRTFENQTTSFKVSGIHTLAVAGGKVAGRSVTR